jgi:3-deoxy-D-manno-octulosonic-acid transferase
MLLWYNLILMIGILVGLPFLMLTLVQAKRRAAFWHRLGWTIGEHVKTVSAVRSARPVWIHALSVGEVVSADPIVDRLRLCLPQYRLVFSATTRTGMDTAKRLFGEKVDALFYFPYDLAFSVRRIIDAVRPQMVVIVETDIWPNFLMYLRRRQIPSLLVNARLSNDSFRGYRLLGGFARIVLESFYGIGAQSDEDASRFVRIGVPAEKVTVTGNVKFDQKESTEPEAEGLALRDTLGLDADRKIVVLGSTHPGEEAVGMESFLHLKPRFTDLMLVVAPRDPGRAEGIANLYRAHGLRVHFLSSLSSPAALDDCDALIVNTIGILRRLYAVADIVFVGGSLAAEGGHNPLEPASLAKPVLFGPDTSDFVEVSAKLVADGGAVRVRNAQELQSELHGLLSDAPRRNQMGENALKVFRANKGSTEKTMALIQRCLAQVEYP